MLATDINIKNHKKETFEKTADNVKANGDHIVPRIQEPNSEKFSTAGIARKVAFDTTDNKAPVIEECTDITARPRVDERAKTRVDN